MNEKVMIRRIALTDRASFAHRGSSYDDCARILRSTILYWDGFVRKVMDVDADDAMVFLKNAREDSEENLRYVYENCYGDTDWFDFAYHAWSLECDLLDALERELEVV